MHGTYNNVFPIVYNLSCTGAFQMAPHVSAPHLEALCSGVRRGVPDGAAQYTSPPVGGRQLCRRAVPLERHLLYVVIITADGDGILLMGRSKASGVHVTMSIPWRL